jgi:hypothetical protein
MAGIVVASRASWRIHLGNVATTNGGIGAGPFPIWARVLTASARHFAAPALAIFVHVFGLRSVLDAVHRIVSSAISIFIESKIRSATGTATLPLVVAGKSITTCKLAATLRAFVRPLAGVQFGVAF